MVYQIRKNTKRRRVDLIIHLDIQPYVSSGFFDDQMAVASPVLFQALLPERGTNLRGVKSYCAIKIQLTFRRFLFGRKIDKRQRPSLPIVSPSFASEIRTRQRRPGRGQGGKLACEYFMKNGIRLPRSNLKGPR